MALIVQRDLVVALKKETLQNLGILNKLQAMPEDLNRQVLKENALEKPTQNLFNHLSHYLVGIIDHQMYTSLSWPLYDSKTEKTYRNELANFINDYSNKGLLYPVMTSYLVNPGCYKVTMLIFQMSQLAILKLLKSKMKKDSHKNLYYDMTELYKSQEKCFLERIEQETDAISSKFSNYLVKRRAIEKIAEVFRKQISKMEAKLSSTNAQKYLDGIVTEFIKKHELDDTTKAAILDIKNINKPAHIFDAWLSKTDQIIDEMESKWSEKISPFLKTCKDAQICTELLIARHTGGADKQSFTIEYNHNTDEIFTNDLQNQVNSQQKYILKNIIKEEKLNFPNLIRGFLVAICFMLKDAEIGDEIYEFNEYLNSGKRNYSEMVMALKQLVERVMKAEANLEPSPMMYRSVSLKNFPVIPPLPDLSELRSTRELQCQTLFDGFTPLTMSKHQFNLRRKTSLQTFVKPQSKSLFTTSFNHGLRDDFVKTFMSSHLSSDDRLNSTQNFHNMSAILQLNKGNETIAECTSGFTKQQILRLLSTKKSSSKKKFECKVNRSKMNVKKMALFNDTNSSNESNGFFRSHSSPNLYEHREKRSIPKDGGRKRSAMHENHWTLLEVSGIATLDKNSSCDTPEGSKPDSSRKLPPALPTILVTSSVERKLHENNFNVDLNEQISIDDTKMTSKEIENNETPKMDTQLIRKTSSLEKIISRFKKVRASVLSEDNGEFNEFKTIVEEKENVNVDIFKANRVLLPDLLSPSCSVVSRKSRDYLDQITMGKETYQKPRESLGTALGVDETFLDQFDLID